VRSTGLLLCCLPMLAVTPLLAQETVPSGTQFIGDEATKQYYAIDCPVVDHISSRMYFRTEAGAQASGYTKAPCEVTEGARTSEPAPVPVPPVSAPATVTAAQAMPEPNLPRRRGFWFNGGLGYGTAGCNEEFLCSGREGGFSGTLSIGGTLGQNVLLGAMSNGWIKDEAGVELTIGTLVGMVRFYPSAAGRFFLQGGLGYGVVELSVDGFGSEDESGVGSMVGLGYDIRIGNNVSLTPYLNGFATGTESATWSVGQFGLSITTH
jgi:hypothetical protein